MHRFGPVLEGFGPTPNATRAAAAAFIAGAHVAIAALLLAAGAAHVLLRETPPLLVSLVAETRPKLPAIPPPPVPRVRAPDIHVAIPPPPDVLYSLPVEREPAPVAAPPKVAAVVEAPVRREAAAPEPVVEPPRADMAYLENPAPAYPSAAKRAGEQGRVMLRVRVDPEGGVERIEVQATSGHPRLDEAALAAVRRWRFAPARRAGQAIAGWALVPITFSLRR